MRKLLIAGVSAFALMTAGAVYAQSSGSGGTGGGGTGGQSQGSSGGAEESPSGAGGGVTSGTANSDTTEQRKDCPPGTSGVNCQPAQ